MNVQQILVVGRATKDAENLKSASGKVYAKFAIAVNEYKSTKEKAKGKSKTDSHGPQDKNVKESPEENNGEATFYDIVIFGKRSEKVAGIVKKGDLVAVTGKPEYSAYISKKDNIAKSSVSVIADQWTVVK